MHNKDSLTNIGKSYKLQKNFLGKKLEQDQIYEVTWEVREIGWFILVGKDVLSTAFSYARYSKGMEELTGFSIENSLSLSSLAKIYFKRLRDENDEAI